MMFNKFIKEFRIKNKATSNIKIKQILSSLSFNGVGIYLGDRLFESDVGTVRLNPLKGTH